MVRYREAVLKIALNQKPLVSVITPTIGRPELRRCIMSVFNQSYKNIQHIIVVDGESHRRTVEKVLRGLNKPISGDLKIVYLPYSTGGWGGRIYAAFPALASGDYIVNCDDDNWFETNHVESLLKSIGSYQWAYSLRNIAYGKCIVRDVCESLGYLHPVWNLPKEHHIDTNCYFLPKKVALRTASFWLKENSRENDWQFYRALRKLFPHYTCTKEHTVNYKISREIVSYFQKGTKWMRKKYGKIMPWERTVSK
jgi:glycosyltransferase involved in cell wall biosynthesis